MELVERYVHQVGRRLPRKLRADVEAELRSLLQDALEERTGRQADEKASFTEDEQVAVLKEFGPPAKVAARYTGQPPYLIGPKVLDAYLIVVAAVAGAGVIASIVTTALAARDMLLTGLTFLELLARAWSLFFSIASSGIGVSTVVFAILERTLPEGELRLSDEKEWDPRALPEIEDRDQIKPVGLLVEVGMTVLWMIVLNAFGSRIGGWYYADGAWHATPPVLSHAFFALYLPLFNVQWVLSIVLNLVLLWRGRWERIARVADLGLALYGIYILARLVGGPSILNLEPALAMFRAVPEMQNTLAPMLLNSLKLAFVVALIVSSVEAVRKLYRIFRPQAISISKIVKAKSA